MTDTTQKLVDLFRGNMPLDMYQGDFMRDAADQLEQMGETRAQLEHITDSANEVLAQLPAEDELVEIIEGLQDALEERTKAAIIEQIEKVLLMLEDKQREMGCAAEYARDVWKDAVCR